MLKINITGVASGLITIYLAILGEAWWVVTGGPGGETFQASISPFAFNVLIIGKPVEIPAVYYLNLASRIALVLAGLEMTVASILVSKPWSRSFISLRILWTSILFLATVYTGLEAVRRMLGVYIPIQGDTVLTYTIPVQAQAITTEVAIQTYFTMTYEIALAGSILALIAMMIHGKLSKGKAPEYKEEKNQNSQ